MNLTEKLSILAAAAKYDVSCSSSGSRRENQKGGIGNASFSGICHSWADDGRCISLLKVLFSNDCVYDCAYCVNRTSHEIPRATFTVEEMVSLTLNFYRRNYIEGLFLSSGVFGSPDLTMEKLLETVKTLRLNHGFNGYIHLKAIPGADLRLIQETGFYVDRMSVNIEFPSEQGLKQLAPQKTREGILRPMAFLGKAIPALGEEKKKFRKAPDFVPAGQSTQMIVGATPESDLQIVRLTESLYQRFSLKRVYFSAYVPVLQDSRLPALTAPPLLRENRLYQADWLLRYYGFRAEEILDESNPDFDPEWDPKTGWALRHLNLFPVEINRVDYETLLRVPGIGVKSARRILSARKLRSLGFEELKKIGVVLKRARFFILCKGKSFDQIPEEDKIREQLKTGTVYQDHQKRAQEPDLFSFNF